MSYRLTGAAVEDLISLTAYGIEAFGPEQARNYHLALERTFELLAEMPRIGRVDPAHPGYRRFLHGRHVIVYRSAGPDVVIARLLHVAMDSGGQDVDGA